MILRLLVSVVILWTSFVTTAEEGGKNQDNEIRRFTPFEPSFLLPLQESRRVGVGGGRDEVAMESHFSFQYIVFNCDLTFDPSEECIKDKNTFETSLSYTGEFDFYMETRESGPVINRISNPALNISWILREDNWKWSLFSVNRLGISVEHRSNGQVVSVDEIETDENSPNFGEFLTQIELENENLEYFDSLSRGANFVTLKSNYRIGSESKNDINCDKTIRCANMWTSFKIYFGDDSNITWGELAGTDTSIEDYDLLRLTMSNKFIIPKTSQPLTFEVDYTVGKELFDTDSYDLNIYTPLTYKGLNIPLLFRYHYGPMDRLSDYTREYESYGIGLYLYL